MQLVPSYTVNISEQQRLMLVEALEAVPHLIQRRIESINAEPADLSWVPGYLRPMVVKYHVNFEAGNVELLLRMLQGLRKDADGVSPDAVHYLCA